ncbi:MAG: hypothetical protein RMJ55_05875 [Roseiflexaceae bacterium]|nr:hypothetical protein [Roseiflexaceae bacterium]
MTIYCVLPDFEAVVQTMTAPPGWTLLRREPNHIRLRSPEGMMSVNALFPAIGGEFGRVYMGALNAIRRIPGLEQSVRDRLYDDVKRAEMILGCVVEPDFLEQDGRFDAVFKIAHLCRGVVFDGFAFLTDSGEVIATLNGDAPEIGS